MSALMPNHGCAKGVQLLMFMAAAAAAAAAANKPHELLLQLTTLICKVAEFASYVFTCRAAMLSAGWL